MAQNLIAIKKLCLTKVSGSSLTLMYFENYILSEEFASDVLLGMLLIAKLREGNAFSRSVILFRGVPM